MSIADLLPQAATYLYDDATAGSFGIGRLSSMTDATGTTGFTYDGVGHVTGKSHAMNSGGPTLSAAWAYSATSLQLRTETYPSGTVQTYVYDANTGRPSITYTGVMVIRGIAWQRNSHEMRHRKTEPLSESLCD